MLRQIRQARKKRLRSLLPGTGKNRQLAHQPGGAAQGWTPHGIEKPRWSSSPSSAEEQPDILDTLQRVAALPFLEARYTCVPKVSQPHEFHSLTKMISYQHHTEEPFSRSWLRQP